MPDGDGHAPWRSLFEGCHGRQGSRPTRLLLQAERVAKAGDLALPYRRLIGLTDRRFASVRSF